jgi:hypothetical protein
METGLANAITCVIEGIWGWMSMHELMGRGGGGENTIMAIYAKSGNNLGGKGGLEMDAWRGNKKEGDSGAKRHLGTKLTKLTKPTWSWTSRRGDDGMEGMESFGRRGGRNDVRGEYIVGDLGGVWDLKWLLGTGISKCDHQTWDEGDAI